MKISSLLLVLTALTPSMLSGQTHNDRRRARLSAVLQLGSSFGGPASGLADQLRQAGYDDSSPCFFCSGSYPHPRQEPPSVAGGLTVRRPISRSISAGLGYTRAGLGGSAGYEAASTDYISSFWHTTIIWAGMFWTTDPGVRLGLGPAWYKLVDPDTEFEQSISKLGVIGEAGVEFPANRTFFLDLAARLNLVPATDVDYATPGESTAVRLRPTWTHVQLQAGLGVHL